jgi:plasmid maintenance system antidote protein VapI
MFNPIIRHEQRIEKVNFIVPERIREACRYRAYTYKEAAKLCDIPEKEFGRMANGHKDIPDEYIFKLMKGLEFPRDFFYQIKWERV